MRVLLDCDPGHDDMLAIYLAAKHCDVVGITTVGGNQALSKVTRNARVVVELGDLRDIPIHQGLGTPVVSRSAHVPEIHGRSGLDGVEFPDPTVPLAGEDAVRFIIEQSHAHDDLWIVATGPLTNLGAAFLLDRTLGDRIAGISIMGGSMTYGNATPAAEFNIWADPEAADIVFRSGVPMKMVGLNITRQASATKAEIARIRDIGTPFAGTVADLIEFYRASLEKVFGLDGASLHDPLAVALLVRPDLFVTRKMHVAVELNGTLTRGMTVCDYRHVRGDGTQIVRQDGIALGASPNTEVVTEADIPGFFDMLVQTLAKF